MRAVVRILRDAWAAIARRRRGAAIVDSMTIAVPLVVLAFVIEVAAPIALAFAEGVPVGMTMLIIWPILTTPIMVVLTVVIDRFAKRVVERGPPAVWRDGPRGPGWRMVGAVAVTIAAHFPLLPLMGYFGFTAIYALGVMVVTAIVVEIAARVVLRRIERRVVTGRACGRSCPCS
jgi:hypothetical protein